MRKSSSRESKGACPRNGENLANVSGLLAEAEKALPSSER
jgi:hypothetical protein